MDVEDPVQAALLEQRRRDRIVERGIQRREYRRVHPWWDILQDQRRRGPKRPRSGFIIFSNDRRAAIRRENPGIPILGWGKRLGDEWRAMTAEEREPYQARSIRDRTRYWREKRQQIQAQRVGVQWVRPPDVQP